MVTALPWEFNNAKLNHNLALDGKAREKRAKYYKYDIPPNLFFPIPVSRTGCLADDALLFCSAIASRFPDTPNVRHELVATIYSAAIIGAARTCNSALRRLQLAALAHAPLPFVKSLHSTMCAFDAGALRSSYAKISSSNTVSSRPHAARNSQLLFSHLSQIFSDSPSGVSEPSGL